MTGTRAGTWRCTVKHLTQAVGQRVIGLISADKNAPKPVPDIFGNELLQSLSSGGLELESYKNSDELSVTSKTYTETIYTVWEI